MNENVGEVVSEWLSSPDGGVECITQNKHRSEEAAVLAAPHKRQISGQNASDLREVIGEKVIVEDVRVCGYSQDEEEKKRFDVEPRRRNRVSFHHPLFVPSASE